MLRLLMSCRFNDGNDNDDDNDGYRNANDDAHLNICQQLLMSLEKYECTPSCLST